MQTFSPHLLVTVLGIQYTARGSHLGAIQISPSSPENMSHWKRGPLCYLPGQQLL